MNDRERQRKRLDELAAKAYEEDKRLAAEFNRRVAEAPEGWLPPAGERHAVSEAAFRKCLNITPEQFRGLDPGQRLELVAYFFAGRESEIPYEDWKLERPPWIPKPPTSGQGRKG